HNSSTPKHGRPLNDSGGSISSAPKQHKASKGIRMQMEDTAAINQQQRKSLPFDQLKRADGHANRLKLGVNNKDDYMVLLTTNKWSTDVNNIPIKITKPKYIPDCFALVVRYVPRDLEPELVKQEIQRTNCISR
ncbi:unnamed protein product, partial [Rotaria magnacalcarata]